MNRKPSAKPAALPDPAPSVVVASKFPKVGSTWRGPDGLALVEYVSRLGLVSGKLGGKLFVYSLDAFLGGFAEVQL